MIAGMILNLKWLFPFEVKGSGTLEPAGHVVTATILQDLKVASLYRVALDRLKGTVTWPASGKTTAIDV